MDLTLNEDQLAVEGAIDKLAEDFSSSPVDFHGFALVSDDLDRELEEGGYFEIAAVPEMGPLSAAVSVARLAQLPYTAEVALSMLVRPHLDIELPRPFGVIEHGRPGRFVAMAKTLIIIDGDSVGIAHPQAGDVEALPDSLFAYPMGKLVGSPEVKTLDAETAATVKTWLRVSSAAEIAGLMQAALDCIVEHVSVRKQFGRPLGTFQALRHRLSECAVLTGGVRWLALKAAWSGDAGDAALACLHAQDSATRIIYDVHQMSGAMGMTLEMDLHLWTYRMKALISDLGGRGGQAQVVAEHCFA
ncbi:acyl-CoA dehydrogenase family protein [Halioxenophilus sp. WMMB6]|uniref:acyl-CoA dehydrogenase family protein n=1 Tax=Halioxenophilus sp. WMMB6 TaxID=3073815 RepID=UPI00295E92E0|nr:acyl-CoA dehydrogenase family protein [Halioxenophilus sp. WMMB6]